MERVTVTEEDRLLRRLAPDMFHPDGTVLSNAYKRRGKPDPEPSVDLERLTTLEESWRRRPEHSKGRLGWALGVLPARVPIEGGLTIDHRPLPDNSSHCVILDERSPSPLSGKGRCRMLAAGTRIIYPLELMSQFG